MLRLLILLLPLTVFGRLIEEQTQYFTRIVDYTDLYSEIDGCQDHADHEDFSSSSLRLTNLRNVRSSRNVSELPSWEGRFSMGGVFNNASEVSADDYQDDWGHDGAESNKISANELGSCIYCAGGGYGFDPALDFIQEEIFSFHKYIDGQDIQITQPKLVDFSVFEGGSDNKMIAYSEDPRYPHGSGELRLFVPFSKDNINHIKVRGRNVTVPISASHSSNFSVSSAYSRTEKDKNPGICIIFHPISTNTPHDIYPLDDSRTEMDGAEMSSLRNKNVVDYNRTNKTNCPMPDWGYQGYYETYENNCMENLVPQVNTRCRCIGDYQDIVCYNSDRVMQMDCRDRADGQKPQAILQEFECENFKIEIDGVEQSCCSAESGRFSGQDLGYACSYAVKNQNFTEVTIRNGSTGKRLKVTRKQ